MLVLNIQTPAESCRLIAEPVSEGAFREAFSKASECDPYITSLSYYLLTGRRGSEIISNDSSSIIVSDHPNLGSKKVVFLPQGVKSFDLVATFLDVASGRSRLLEFLVGRVGEDDAKKLERLLRAKLGSQFSFDIHEENHLDWRFPVHTIDTKKVSEMNGHQFKDFRKNIGRTKILGLTHRPVNPREDALIIRSIAERWARKRHAENSQHYFADLEPYTWLSARMASGELVLDGRIIYEQQLPIAFVLWEPSRNPSNTAVSLASLSVSEHKGVSEYLYYLMCLDLQSAGIEKVCIGGSETEGLDRFKRKMSPTTSTHLRTLKISRN